MSLRQARYILTHLYGVDASDLDVTGMATVLLQEPRHITACPGTSGIDDFGRMMLQVAERQLQPHTATRH